MPAKNTDTETIATGLRLPSDLHAKLKEQAEANHRSLNSQIVHMLQADMDKGEQR